MVNEDIYAIGANYGVIQGGLWVRSDKMQGQANDQAGAHESANDEVTDPGLFLSLRWIDGTGRAKPIRLTRCYCLPGIFDFSSIR